jgi:hypothetical protein
LLEDAEHVPLRPLLDEPSVDDPVDGDRRHALVIAGPWSVRQVALMSLEPLAAGR